MKNKILQLFEQRYDSALAKLPEFRAGDTVNVHYRITEGAKSRIQQFEGTVLRCRKGKADASFTVRKISSGGIGVERVFPMISPNVEKIEVKARGRVRRARLYYLRDLAGKAARIKSRYLGDIASSEAKADAKSDARADAT